MDQGWLNPEHFGRSQSGNPMPGRLTLGASGDGKHRAEGTQKGRSAATKIRR